MKFAAFIMTYERPEAVLKMIETLLRQTVPPQEILVVDNSETELTKEAVLKLSYPNVTYVRVGYNAGPAGASYIALKQLAAGGYDWIYWGDDDDPPKALTDFEQLFDVLKRGSAEFDKIGIVAKGAGKFKKLTGRTSSYMNMELKERIMEADVIAGNNVSIISGAMVRSGILPTPDLFFGFEELDFCLKARTSGFKIIFDAKAFLDGRRSQGKGAPNYKWKGKSIGISSKLWRQYYSTRNILRILAFNKLWIPMLVIITRTMLKSVYGFYYGRTYGVMNFRIQWLALIHCISGKKGKTDLSNVIR